MSHMCVDLVDVGVLAELGDDVDRRQTVMTILVGSGMLGGITTLRPNGNPKEIGTIFARASRAIGPRRLASHVPRERKICVSWPPIPTVGTIGTPAFSAAFT